jgi:sortase A
MLKNIIVKILLAAIVVSVVSVGAYYFFGRNTKADDKTAVTISDQPLVAGVTNSNPDNQSEGKMTLEIPDLKITAPIVLNVDGNNKESYMKALEGGIAHMKGTALPGNSGNGVIFGHSSYYEDQPGNYKSIFATLNNLSIGDPITVEKQGGNLNFIVFNKQIVDPDDVNVVNQNYSKKELTLITCWPINTTKQRLIVSAELK